ncbi:uncharacterized protein LOC142175517 [Nicotiana tabacum]|uniref:Uncharacterized protein LOC142175517 n=1 Tax=Nicotiana tabacum TaxID=4097 RepID=A0AC58TMT2_TOBAC
MAVDDENTTITSKNTLHVSSDDEFEEGVTVVVTHPLYLAPGDTSGISLISFQLTGTDNYSLWYRSMRIALLGHNKRGIVDGSWPNESGIAYVTSAQTVWLDLQKRFDKVNDTRYYNLHKETTALCQGTSSISVYYSKIKDIWDEFEFVIPTPGCDCAKTKEFIVHLRKQKVYQFLMCLNDSYSQARSQIHQAYAMLISDKSQRSVAASAGVLGPPLIVNANTYDSTTLYSAKSNSNPKFRKNYNVQCNFCKMKGHSKENCYKIIGYPSDYKFKKKGVASAHNVMVEPGYSMPLYAESASQCVPLQSLPANYSHHHAMSQGAENYQVQGVVNAKPSSQGDGFPFTKEQYEKIMQILYSSHNRISSSTSQAYASGTTIALLASSPSPQEWIIDTRATNYMVSDINLLTKTSLTTLTNPRKVLQPNGDVTQVTHIGDSHISDNNVIKEVFYVPQFKFNFLSVSKVTRDSICFASFYPDFCVFQDLFSGRVREIARIKSHRRNSTIDVSLWHKRLRHVSSIVLKKLFPAKLANITEIINKFTVCPCAKQTRLPFPNSCIKSTVAFDLIHVNVWGPYKYATFDGHRYFLTVVDDFTRLTWLFLLKLKSDVCVVLTQFVVFVQTQFNKVLKAVRSENGPEFINFVCHALFQKYGSIHQKTCAYTP